MGSLSSGFDVQVTFVVEYSHGVYTRVHSGIRIPEKEQ